MHRSLKIAGLAIVAVLVVIQLVPYGHDHSNPRVTKDAPWPTKEAASIARASCYDCHSNETKWYWFTNIAPVSIYTVHDVKEGRASLNFSEWDQPQRADEIGEVVREGGMPPRQYTLMHRGTSLSAHEKQVLLDAIQTMEPPPGGGREGGGEGGEG